MTPLPLQGGEFFEVIGLITFAATFNGIIDRPEEIEHGRYIETIITRSAGFIFNKCTGIFATGRESRAQPIGKADRIAAMLEIVTLAEHAGLRLLGGIAPLLDGSFAHIVATLNAQAYRDAVLFGCIVGGFFVLVGHGRLPSRVIAHDIPDKTDMVWQSVSEN